MEQENEKPEEFESIGNEPYGQMEFSIPEMDAESPAPETVPPAPGPASPTPEPAVEAEPKIPAYHRPLWAVLLITLWIAGMYGAFYYFLITHRFASYIVGG